MLGIGIVATTALTVRAGQPPPAPGLTWSTVINNNDAMPGAPGGRTFNSYNQPSVNVHGLVVVRARSRGGDMFGPATHGVYTRDMAAAGSPIVRILDRSTEVPQPNNLLTTFVETPAFPRIDMEWDTIGTRGNHPPVWEHDDTRSGTTGIYTNPYGPLITGAAKLGDVPEFSFFEVPEFPGTVFEVFPGAPAVSDFATIVFKGNYTIGDISKTGVYYRDLDDAPAGGQSPVVLIANNTHTSIPGTSVPFGSTAPPSAVDRMAVFSGFDDEGNPTLGGIYLAPLVPYDPLSEQPDLTTLVAIGEQVPGESVQATFSGMGEGLAFDGQVVGFWAAWGTQTRTVRLYCPSEGNKDRIDYCNRALVCTEGGEVLGDPDSICDDTGCYQDKPVPVEQGIFVHDIGEGQTRTVAKTGARFDEFLFWNYSGKVPCVGEGGGEGEEGGEDEGEPARWRSSAFVAVSGSHTAFKAEEEDVVGIYLGNQPGQNIMTLVATGADGQSLDPEAPLGSTITEVGLEREGLRGDILVVSAKMEVEGGEEEADMAGVYLAHVPGKDK